MDGNTKFEQFLDTLTREEINDLPDKEIYEEMIQASILIKDELPLSEG